IENLDGGFTVCGTIETPLATTLLDMVLLKVDGFGDTLWQRQIALRGNQRPYGLFQLPDSTYLVAGHHDNFDSLGSQVMLARFDAAGDTLWTRTWGDTAQEIARDLVLTPNGTCALAGYRDDGNVRQALLLEADLNGDTLQWRTFSGPAGDAEFRGLVAEGHGWTATGWTASAAGDQELWLVQVDTALNLRWMQVHAEPWNRFGNAVRRAPNGDYWVAGVEMDLGLVAVDALLFHADSTGGFRAEYTFGGPGTDRATDLQFASNGELVFSGYRSLINLSSDLLVMRVDTLGNVIWSGIYGGISFDYANSLRPVSDGGFIVAGNTGSFTPGDGQLYVVRLDSLGNVVGILDENTETVLAYPNPVQNGVKWLGVAAGEVEVMDLDGRRVLQATWRAGDPAVSVEGLRSGLYLWRMRTEEGRVYSGKLRVE
ncbi:MAG: T9SS type A sorting domain-containing protein, partial [Bacteroidota bacterium]